MNRRPLVLALGILPRVPRAGNPAALLRFESTYERIAPPALLMQVVSGLPLAHRMVADVSRWLDLPNR